MMFKPPARQGTARHLDRREGEPMTKDGRRPISLVLQEGDFEPLPAAPGLELARVLTSAGTTGLGGGMARFKEDAELADWTLRYDEVFFVLEGVLSVESEGESVSAGPGEIVLIPKGATVTYRGTVGTRAYFVLHPRVWQEELDGASGKESGQRRSEGSA